MAVDAIEVGSKLPELYARKLKQRSVGDFDRLVGDIKSAELIYRDAELLSHHLEKHLPEFADLNDAESYVHEARAVVRESERILAHIHRGQVQLRFFGERGYVVVDPRGCLCGYFGHTDIDQTFSALKQRSLWLRTR